MASAGKVKGTRGGKLGNAYLRWAFGEAAVICKRDNLQVKAYAKELEASAIVWVQSPSLLQLIELTTGGIRP